MNKLKSWLRAQFPLILILIIGFSLRTIGNNWDQGRYLHPDERFVAMVVDKIEMPATVTQYMDPAQSTLSPFNNDYKFYVYGGLPILLVKSTAVTLDEYFPQQSKYDSYDHIYMIGRFYNTVFDLGTLVLIYLITKKIISQDAAVVAGLLYSLTVMAIQQSNFFTMDLFAVFFMTLALKLLVDFLYTKSKNVQFSLIYFCALAAGAALASKFSALILLPLVLLMLLVSFIRKFKLKAHKYNFDLLIKYLSLICIFIIFCYLSFRFLQPFIFADSNLFNVSFNKDFLDAFDYQYKLGNGTATAPFTIQWFTSTPIVSPFINLAVWGLGIPLTLSILGGISILLIDNIKLIKHKKFSLILANPNLIELILLGFAGASFVYLGINFIKYLRYFLPIIPILIIFAAKFIARLSKKGKIYYQISLVLLIAIQIYAFAFLAIYMNPNTRITASAWMASNVPEGVTIGHEIWDDFVPMDIDGVHKDYKVNEVDMYRDDNDDKINYLLDYINKTDYIILASSRQSKSVGALPQKYPLTSKFYQLLESGNLGYSLVHKEHSYPNILGIDLNDEWAEDSFFIYDHPSIWIYKKDHDLSADEFKDLLLTR